MTKDEAVEIFHKITYPENTVGMPSNPHKFSADRRWSIRAVDGFIALGILKVDDPPPRSPTERAVDAMFGYGDNGMITPRHAIEAIQKVGLKIVEDPESAFTSGQRA